MLRVAISISIARAGAAALVLLGAGCDAGADPPDNRIAERELSAAAQKGLKHIDALSAYVCERKAACCTPQQFRETPYPTQRACLDFYESDEILNQIRRDLIQERIKLDEAEAEKALTAVRRLTCADARTRQEYFYSVSNPALYQVYRPNVPIGSPCLPFRLAQLFADRDTNCIDGYCSTKPGEDPRCARLLGLGATCTHSTQCISGSFCSASLDVCSPPQPVGSPCDQGRDCASNYCSSDYECADAPVRPPDIPASGCGF